MSDKISINLHVAVEPDKLRAQIGACFAAKRVVSEAVQNHLDDIIDQLDDVLDAANTALEKRSEDEN